MIRARTERPSSHLRRAGVHRLRGSLDTGGPSERFFTSAIPRALPCRPLWIGARSYHAGSLRRREDRVRRLVSPVLKWRVGVRWYLIVVLGPTAIVWVASNLSTFLGAPTPGFGGSQIPLALPAYVLFLLLAAAGEEIGWRGYALPRLQADLSALSSALIIGLVWALWHLPLFFIAGLPQTFLPFAPFLVWIVSQAVIFAWVYNSIEGSLLFPILLHAAINLMYSSSPYCRLKKRIQPAPL
jgi:membrane protease YdiL (CAAX protease family)